MSNNLEVVEMHNRLEESYLSYAMATIVDRALPDVRDGLLPVHKRILYAMYNAGILSNKERAKSTEPVSETMKIHNHGDSSIYQSLSLLTEFNETLLHPFIDGEGAFGKVYSSDSPSHMRYTFCRLNKFSEEMFQNINKNIVRMIGEGEHFQPLVLTPSYPSILVKPNSAIAVGESCSFGSFPIDEVCNTTIAYIKDNNIDLIDYIKPDFPTGGYLLYDESTLRKIYDTGNGSITLRSKYRFDSSLNMIEIYEIPYSIKSSRAISEIKDKMNIFKEILDVRNETGFNKKNKKEELKITIDVKKNTDVEQLMNKLFMSTCLQSNFSYNMNCLVDYKPTVLGIKGILDNWLKFRVECIRKAMEHDISTKSTRLHFLKGLEKVLLDIDRAIDIIRKSNESEIIINLCETFSIDNIQSENISNMKLRNINKNYILNQIKNIKILEDEIELLKYKISNEDEINNIIISDLERVGYLYKKPRLTEIISGLNSSKKSIRVSDSDMVDDFNHYISISKEGYLYKYLRATSTFKLKENDEIISTISTSNKATILVFTNKGNCHKIFSHSIDSKLPSQLGYFMPSLVNLQKDENIISVQVTRNYEGSLINIYEGNKLARIDLKAFRTEQKRILLKNSLSLETPLINQFIITEDIDILVQSTIDKVLICNTSDFNSKSSKNANGDGLIKSKNDSVVKYVEILSNINLDQIENVDYYRGKRNATGSFLKKSDKIQNIKISK